jgi:acetoin utilization deacetylase AcuC-like enzyme
VQTSQSQDHIVKNRQNLDVKAFYTDHFVLPLPVGHRFPMQKYRLLRDRVAQMMGIELCEAPRATDDDLCLAHTQSYVQAVSEGRLSDAEIREIGFPWSAAMVERSRRSSGATLAAAQMAKKDFVSANLAGGTHHAYANKGSGFCVFNDAAITALRLKSQGYKQVLVIDLDVHQGNGTASILQEHPEIFTFSMHGEKNFPFRKEASSLDLGLPDACDDETYLRLLADSLSQIEELWIPDFVIYLAGADPHEGDRLGRLKLSMTGMAKRDQMVFDFCHHWRTPCVIAMAGGYGLNIETTVEVHAQTINLAYQHYLRCTEIPA